MGNVRLAKLLPASFNPSVLFDCQWVESAVAGEPGAIVVRRAMGSIKGIVATLHRRDRVPWPSYAACPPGPAGPTPSNVGQPYVALDSRGRVFYPRLPDAGACSTQFSSQSSVPAADFRQVASAPVTDQNGTLVLSGPPRP